MVLVSKNDKYHVCSWLVSRNSVSGENPRLFCALVRHTPTTFLWRKALTFSLISLDPVVTAPLFEHHEGCVAQVVDFIKDHE